MKTKRTLVGPFVVVLLLLGVTVFAQVSRPYRNGSVWDIGFIRMKPGMESAYLNYVATDWKKHQEELKKDGQILSYKVLTTESHGANDWNIMLMTEYKDMATKEANEAKEDALRPVGQLPQLPRRHLPGIELIPPRAVARHKSSIRAFLRQRRPENPFRPEPLLPGRFNVRRRRHCRHPDSPCAQGASPPSGASGSRGC